MQPNSGYELENIEKYLPASRESQSKELEDSKDAKNAKTNKNDKNKEAS